VRPKRARLGWKAERRERLLNAVLQQLDGRIGCDAGPEHPRPLIVGEHAESLDVYGDRARFLTGLPTRGLLERRAQLGLARVIDLAQELEAQVNIVGPYPLEWKPVM